MASLVCPYFDPVADHILTSRCFDYPARVLQFLSHEGAIRRDRTQHLQTLPNFRKCDVDRLAMSKFTAVLITLVGMDPSAF